MLWNSFKQMELLHKLVPILLQYATWRNAHGTEEYIYKCHVYKYSFKDAFSDFCPFLQTPTLDLCVIVEFLYYLHIPPPPDVSNFADFASFLWLSIVKVYAIDLHCRYIYIVVDKPEFLPPSRTLVHKSRSKKSGRYSGHEPQVTGPTPVPHGKSYSSLLSSSKVFKANLIKYITLFIEWGKKTTNIHSR